MSQWIEGKVVTQTQWTKTVFSLYVEADIQPFIAGQFTQLSLQKEAPQKLFKPYSFVNAPHESTLEFYYNVIKGGALTSQLSRLTKEDPVFINQKASGFFILADVKSSPILWLIATGTGLGVFLSVLKTQEPWQRFQQVVLVHSVHEPDALTHQLVIQQFQQQYHQRFTYLPLVTREKLGHVVSSRITDLLKEGELERLTQLSISSESSQFMLCGNPAMVQEMTELLQARGLHINRFRQKGQITVESYWKL